MLSEAFLPSPSSERGRWRLKERSSLQDLTKNQQSLGPFYCPPVERQFNADPRDHSRLKACWDAMLSNQLLTFQLVNVLPFYLSSSFTNVQSHTSLQIPLPRNSYTPENYESLASGDGISRWKDAIDPDAYFDPKLYANQTANDGLVEIQAIFPRRVMSSWATMHLAKSLRTVVACKDRLWLEWEKLYRENRVLPPVMRTSRPKDFPRHIVQFVRAAMRDEFEQAWANWEKYVVFEQVFFFLLYFGFQ